MDTYKFNPEEAFCHIRDCWTLWAKMNHAERWVVGISGGKDSSVVAASASRIFGKDSVLGVLMPNGEQSDIGDSKEVCLHLGIEHVTVNIKNGFGGLIQEIEQSALWPLGIKEPSYDTITNLPARLRMATLYAVAQTVRGMVLNTCNLSEDTVGYATLWGDNAGSYAPIQGLTVTEIRQLGDWLGLPYYLVHKTPVDGLQSKTDEEKLGFSYEELDQYIRLDEKTPEFQKKIDAMYRKNKFKTDIVRIPGPNFDFLGNFVRYHNLNYTA